MNRIKDLRQEKGLLQKDVETALNIGRGTLSNYENEKRGLTQDLIDQLCKLFDVTADYLLCRSENSAPQISAEDLALLRAYHSASDRDRSLVDQILQLTAIKIQPAAHEVRVAG